MYYYLGHTEPAHCFTFFRDQVISATTGNRIAVHSSVDAQVDQFVLMLNMYNVLYMCEHACD